MDQAKLYETIGRMYIDIRSLSELNDMLKKAIEERERTIRGLKDEIATLKEQRTQTQGSDS